MASLSMKSRQLKETTSDSGSDETTSEVLLDEEYQEFAWEPMDADAYGASLCSIIRDSYFVANGSENHCIRRCRMVASVGMILVVFTLQIFIVASIKELVTARQVFAVQQAYEDYEQRMYVDGANGVKEFVPANFHMLAEDEQEEICAMPLSQPMFFFAILFTWTFSVMNNLRRLIELTFVLVSVTPTLKTSSRSLLFMKRSSEVRVLGLTKFIKAMVIITVLVPSSLVNLTLLWFGARWLAATLDFGELLLNAVALEFVLLMKDLFYRVVVSKRHRMETETLTLRPNHLDARVNYMAFFGSYIYLGLTVLMVYLYIYHLQTVIPEYNWDVAEICDEFLKNTSIHEWQTHR